MAPIRRFSKSRQQVPSQHWLTTFNDLITLLMVFFVLLFSMGSLDRTRFTNFRSALQSAMGVLYPGQNGSEGVLSDRQGTPDQRGAAATGHEAGDNRPQWPDTSGLQAEYTRKGIRLTLRGELLFDSGSAHITGQGAALLDRIGAVIKPMKRYVRIEGYTDNRPIATRRYPSNWELSTARAVNVAKYFIEQVGVAPALLSAAGYGPYKPRRSNDSELHRAENRRVEIILGPQEAAPQNL